MAKLCFLNRYLSSIDTRQTVSYVDKQYGDVKKGYFDDVNNSVYKSDCVSDAHQDSTLLRNSPIVVLPVDVQLSVRTNCDKLLYDVAHGNCDSSNFVMFCNEPFDSAWEECPGKSYEDTKYVDVSPEFDSGIEDMDFYISCATGGASWQRIDLPQDECNAKRSFIDAFWLPEAVIRALNCQIIYLNRIVFQADPMKSDLSIDSEDRKYLTVEDIDNDFYNRDRNSSNELDEIGFGDNWSSSSTQECSIQSLDGSFLEEIERLDVEGSELKRKLFTSMDETEISKRFCDEADLKPQESPKVKEIPAKNELGERTNNVVVCEENSSTCSAQDSIGDPIETDHQIRCTDLVEVNLKCAKPGKTNTREFLEFSKPGKTNTREFLEFSNGGGKRTSTCDMDSSDEKKPLVPMPKSRQTFRCCLDDLEQVKDTNVTPLLVQRLEIVLKGINLTNRTLLDFVNGGHGIVNPQFQEFHKQNSRGRRRGRSKRNAIKEISGVTYCSICSKKFDVKRKLERHQEWHTGIRKYLCTSCGQGFNDKFDLKRHTRMHTGVRPYQCRFCTKSFTQRCSLELHASKIHGVDHRYKYKQRRSKLYVCEECGYSTRDPKRHVVHIKIHLPS